MCIVPTFFSFYAHSAPICRKHEIKVNGLAAHLPAAEQKARKFPGLLPRVPAVQQIVVVGVFIFFEHAQR